MVTAQSSAPPLGREGHRVDGRALTHQRVVAYLGKPAPASVAPLTAAVHAYAIPWPGAPARRADHQSPPEGAPVMALNEQQKTSPPRAARAPRDAGRVPVPSASPGR